MSKENEPKREQKIGYRNYSRGHEEINIMYLDAFTAPPESANTHFLLSYGIYTTESDESDPRKAVYMQTQLGSVQFKPALMWTFIRNLIREAVNWEKKFKPKLGKLPGDEITIVDGKTGQETTVSLKREILEYLEQLG